MRTLPTIYLSVSSDLQLLQDLGKVKSVDETWKFEDRLTRAK